MAMAATERAYPVRLDIAYPESLSRWLIFVKWLLAIPHLLIIYVLQLLVRVLTFLALFAILFTRKYPRGLFDLAVNAMRWNNNVNAYIFLMRDEYPPFTWEPGQYPVTYEVDYPPELNRWLPLVKWLLAVPHYIALIFLGLASAVVILIAFFAILFTGKFPRGMFDFVVGVTRWSQRVTAYVILLTDEYPPFRLGP
jgi:hypothetical protein